MKKNRAATYGVWAVLWVKASKAWTRIVRWGKVASDKQTAVLDAVASFNLCANTRQHLTRC